jgi:LysM repeat protein
MIKRFLLHQKINKRTSRDQARRLVVRRIREFSSTALETLRSTAQRMLHHRAFGYVASSLVLVTAAIVLALVLVPKAPAAVSTVVEPVPTPQQIVEIGATLQRGAGVEFNRDKDIPHMVQEGETFSEIASIYNISSEKLALYNHIADINRIKEGMTITIPSLKAESQIASTISAQRLPALNNQPKRTVSSIPLEIQTDLQVDGVAVTAHFSAKAPEGVTLERYEWDLGNGRKSYRANTFWSYDVPGTYSISLKASDADGREYNAEKVLIDVPHPGTYQSTLQQFMTLESVDQTFTIQGHIEKINCYDQKYTEPAITEVSSAADGGMVYKATRPGYFSLEVEQDDGAIHRYYFFVSPIDSKHSDRTDLNWYRTQFNTGTQSNCGPASTSMAISWATGEYVPVSSVRDEVGWTENGATSYEDLRKALTGHKVSSRIVPIYSTQDFFDIIDRGNIAIVLYNSGGPKYTKDPASSFFGRYYFDAVGHYLVIKGYSKDKQYVVTYDPIPSDWSSNSFRYADGISMIGRNRYYGAKEIFSSLRRRDAIEVMR